MSKLTPEIEQRIENYHQDGFISRAEATMLTSYFLHNDTKVAARVLKILHESLKSMLSKLRKDGILLKTETGSSRSESVGCSRGRTSSPCDGALISQDPIPYERMNKVELSEKAKSICGENYDTNCGGCLLRYACVHTSTGYGHEGLYKWVEGVNQAAKQIAQDGQLTLF